MLTLRKGVSLQIHAFADSSERAYAANVYVRVETQTEISSQLVSAKPRVAPLEPITLPRLELLSGLLLVNLVTKVSAALSKIIQFDKLTCWLDSQAALWWIYGENKQFKRFVQSRVEKVRKLVNKERFRYVPSELNPSDIGSRGAKLSEIRNNLFYWNGPDF